jgi:cobalt-zinc-cadmium efflux system outer membrane protein
MLTRLWSLAAVLTAAAGCAAFDPRGGFDDVHRLVTNRVGAGAVWFTGGEEDECVRERVGAHLRAPLSVDDVVELVLLNNAELQATYQELGIAQADVVRAGLFTNLTLGLERRFPGRALEADVTLGFLDVFLIPLRKRVAGAAFEAAKITVTNEVVKYAFEARTAYFELQMKELRERVVAATEASAESARRLREAGNVPLLEVQREELLAAEARLELAAAEGEMVEARERLNRLMGLWGRATGWSVPGRLPELPADDGIPEALEPVAIESRLDLAAARRELEGAAENVGIA